MNKHDRYLVNVYWKEMGHLAQALPFSMCDEALTAVGARELARELVREIRGENKGVVKVRVVLKKLKG